MAQNPEPLHALVIPYPTQGHMTPMMQFARNLASRGLIVTFVTTHHTHHQITESHSHSDQADQTHQDAQSLDLDIRSAQISDGLPFYFDRSTGSQFMWITWCYHLIGNPFFIDSLASPTVTSYSFSERKDSTQAIQQAKKKAMQCTVDFLL